MLKRILTVSFLLFFLSAPRVYAAFFQDLTEKSPYYAAVEYLRTKNIIQGYSDGTFKPEQTINRAEALKIVLLANKTLQNPSNQTLTEIHFPDVKKNDWFYSYVQEAFSRKIVEGYPDSTFKPANTINAVESLKIILLTFGIDTQSVKIETAPYPDVNTTDWFAPYVQLSKQKQLVEASSNGNFVPAHNMSRGEFSEIIYRLMYIKENSLDKFPLSLNWPTYTDPNGNFTLKYPFNWEKIVAKNQVIFWKKDALEQQLSFARVTPNSAVLITTVDPNTQGLKLQSYVDAKNYSTDAKKQLLTLNDIPFGMVTFSENGLQDSYFEMPNQSIMIGYSEIGSGSLKEQLSEQLRYILGSVRYGDGKTSTSSGENTQTANDNDLLLSAVREKILVKGEGKKAIESLGDAFIFETDAIGIGTGPIDYYYSLQYDVSIKFERDTSTILGVKSTKTTNF